MSEQIPPSSTNEPTVDEAAFAPGEENSPDPAPPPVQNTPLTSIQVEPGGPGTTSNNYPANDGKAAGSGNH